MSRSRNQTKAKRLANKNTAGQDSSISLSNKFKQLIIRAHKQHSHILYFKEGRKDSAEIESWVEANECSMGDVEHCHGVFMIGDNPLFAECALEVCEAPNGNHTWTLVLYDGKPPEGVIPEVIARK